LHAFAARAARLRALIHRAGLANGNAAVAGRGVARVASPIGAIATFRALERVGERFIARRFGRHVVRSRVCFVARRLLIGERCVGLLLLGIGAIVRLVDAHDEVARRKRRACEGNEEEGRPKPGKGTKVQAVCSQSARFATPSILGSGEPSSDGRPVASVGAPRHENVIEQAWR
jgi:hypothetical protein